MKCEQERNEVLAEWVNVFMYEFKSNYMMNFRLLYDLLELQLWLCEDEWHNVLCAITVFSTKTFSITLCYIVVFGCEDDVKQKRASQRKCKPTYFRWHTHTHTHISVPSAISFEHFALVLTLHFRLILKYAFAFPCHAHTHNLFRWHLQRLSASNDRTYWWHCFSLDTKL